MDITLLTRCTGWKFENIEGSATPIKEPTKMPWGQITAFFADAGNIHEIFC